MKRQAIPICIDTLRHLNKEIRDNIKEMERCGLKLARLDKGRIAILFPIVNYPTKNGKRLVYCSDTWQFEGIPLFAKQQRGDTMKGKRKAQKKKKKEKKSESKDDKKKD